MPFWKRPPADDQVRQLLAQGQQSIHQHQPAVALPLFEQCVAMQPSNGMAWSSLGQALVDLGRLPEATAALDKALRLTPTDVAAWYNHGLAQRRQGAFDQALASVDQALRLNPGAWLAWHERGVILCQNVQPEQIASIDEQHLAAFDAFSQAVALQPADVSTWQWRGRLAWRIGLSAQVRERAGMLITPNAHWYCDAALASFDQVLAQVPDDPATLFDKGRTLVAFDRSAEARTVYRRLTAVANHAGDWYQLALVNDALDDIDELRDSLAQAFALDPTLRAQAAGDFEARRADPALQQLLEG